MNRLLHFLNKMRIGSEQVLGMNRRNVEFVKVLNKRRDFPLADDKVLAKEFFAKHGVPTAPTIEIISSLFETTDFHQRFQLSDFVIKPACGSQGKGILVITGRDKTGFTTISGIHISASKIEYELASILFGKYSIGRSDKILIEKRLVPSEEFEAISVKGLFDVRVIVVKGIPIGAMLRLPTKQSQGKANLHQGGIGAGVDIVTGKTTHAFHLGRLIRNHPDTSASLINFQVPHWKKIIEISRLIGTHSPLQYIGVDLTIDKIMGPCVLEFNARPGLGIQNANKKGLQQLIREAFERENS